MSNKLTLGSFVEKANIVHKGLFVYDKVIYVKNNVKVLIYCKKHGYFNQRPADHLTGYGCMSCAREVSSANKRFDFSIFLNRFRNRYGDTYDYSESLYQGSMTPIAIKCSVHGVFYKTPTKHSMGEGCTYCSAAIKNYNKLSSSRFNYKEAFVYFVQMYNDTESFYKVGVSVDKDFRYTYMSKVYIVKEVFCAKYSLKRSFEIEQIVLSIMNHKKYNPLLKFAGRTECFSEDIDLLKIGKLFSNYA